MYVCKEGVWNVITSENITSPWTILNGMYQARFSVSLSE